VGPARMIVGELDAQTRNQNKIGKADVGATEDSVTIKATAPSSWAGRRSANKHGLSVADAMYRNRSKSFSKYPWLWIPAFAGMTWESLRTIYRRCRRCCH
jgi:hypothetical protein